MKIGIDAVNLRGGGGVTHIVNLLGNVDPEKFDVESVVIWSCGDTLSSIPEKSWLIKRALGHFERGLFLRALWQRFFLDRALRLEKCDVLFVPGGSYAGSFKPVVTMCQNMLPFEFREIKRFGWSWRVAKLLILRLIQGRTFKRADVVIYLSEFARGRVEGVVGIGQCAGYNPVIAHGIGDEFKAIGLRRGVREHIVHEDRVIKLLYVSVVDAYKHQASVIEAVRMLSFEGFSIQLDLVGPAYPPALKELTNKVNEAVNEGIAIKYHGAVEQKGLVNYYREADVFVFASTCENLPIILLEAMASGLPIVCSDYGPMPEVLGEGGVYFESESVESIVSALRVVLEDAELRSRLGAVSAEKASVFSWGRCADETFQCLVGSVDKAHLPGA